MFTALRSRRTVAVGIVALAVSAGVATLAYASIPDGNGVIHACYGVNGHGQVDGNASLRVIDPASTNTNGQACKNNEKALDWSQTGPTGATGPQGPQGPTGATGPQGPEGSGHAFIATTQGHVTIHHNLANIVTLTGLPAGNYLVWSPVFVIFDDETGTNDVCEWRINGSQIVVPEGDTFMFDAHDDAFGRADISGHVTLASDNSTIEVLCDANTDGAEAHGQITALRVGAIN
jgi:uncharacterized membrane protein